jgi:putative glucoamylase
VFDCRGIRDEFMRAHDSDCFENTRHATCVQQEDAIRNPGDFVDYGEHCRASRHATRLAGASVSSTASNASSSMTSLAGPSSNQSFCIAG